MPITNNTLRTKSDSELKELTRDLNLTKVETALVAAEESRRARAEKDLDALLKDLRRRVEEKRSTEDLLGVLLPSVAPGVGQDACERLRLAGDMLHSIALMSRNADLAKAFGELVGLPGNSATVLNAAGKVGTLLYALSRLKV